MDSVWKYIGISKFPTMNWILCVSIWMLILIGCNESATLKRSASPNMNLDNSESSLDKMNVNYDEYPVS